MLNGKRFDYFPMSIAEATSALKANPEYSHGFMIVPNIIVYYPLPIIFYVSESQPQLAERLRKGLIAAEKDGSLDKLFMQFFADDITQIQKQHPHCFVLENPYIPEHLNQRKPLLLERQENNNAGRNFNK
jgi:ABC-type amino acid transport substrate-binding protein